MSCITQGITKSCDRKISGGLRKVFLAAFPSIDNYTEAADNSISAVTMVDPLTDFFYEFEFKENTASLTQEEDNTTGANINTVTLTMVFPSPTQAEINAINDLKNCQCGISAIVLENVKDDAGNREGWVVGQESPDYLKFATSSFTTGTARGDANEITVVLTATLEELAPRWTGLEAGIPVQP